MKGQHLGVGLSLTYSGLFKREYIFRIFIIHFRIAALPTVYIMEIPKYFSNLAKLLF
jgi:hypothetical protein